MRLRLNRRWHTFFWSDHRCIGQKNIVLFVLNEKAQTPSKTVIFFDRKWNILYMPLFLWPSPSFPILHFPFFIPHSSFFVLHSSFFVLHSSFFVLHSSFFILRSSLFPNIYNVSAFLLLICVNHLGFSSIIINFFFKTFGGLLFFIYLCTRFPKIFRLAYLRNSFFEKIYIDRSSTRSTFPWTARFFMGCFFGTGCMRQTVRFNWTSFSYRFYFLLQ